MHKKPMSIAASTDKALISHLGIGLLTKTGNLLALKRLIHVGHISLVMLVMMNFHRHLIDVGFESSVTKGESCALSRYL
jgi:hypothetical protein